MVLALLKSLTKLIKRIDKINGGKMIAIVDYGLGNLKSIKNMLGRIGVKAIITNDFDVISKAEKLILPGVGSFDAGMNLLRSKGLQTVLDKEVLQSQKPVLGICLGMQLMTRSSEEGNESGLGWLNAETKKFRFDSDSELKIPHMGWNFVAPVRCGLEKQSIFAGMEGQENRFYFVHSYFVQCNEKNDILAESFYGEKFTCAFRKGNFFGVQFHPEKSHKFGMKLLKNFAELGV